MSDIPTIAEAARLIAAHELSPVELTEACLARITALDGTLHSFVTVTADRARDDARRAETAIMAAGPASPLHGIPYSLKDVFDTKGIRTTGQSRLLADNVPSYDSACNAQLEAAGAVLLGKNTTWEFAHGGPSWDVVAPPACNPWDTACSPAGSSSGSAVAIAAGLTLGAMGTDTGGSIRGPAAVCGIAGLKPTYGLVSRVGVIPNCFSHDHAGPMAWTTEDVAILLQGVARHDPDDIGSAQVEIPDYRAALTGRVAGLIIGVPWRWFEADAPLTDPTRAAFQAALDVFKGMGAEVREVVLPPIPAFDDAKRVIAMVDLFTIHGADMRTRPEMFGAALRYRIMGGALIRAEDYLQAMRARTDLARAMQTVMATVDLVMLPTNEPAGPLAAVPQDAFFHRPSLTTAFNVGGNPALSICSGFNRAGLPFSLQIVGRLFDEATVLRAGDAYERATPWRNRRPPVAAQHGPTV
jgi:aspartyl-tRNA(Asn)/glutamyl-tRNA(Gln) amidotransferase subunit A